MAEFSTALEEGDEGTVLRLVDADPALLETVVDMRYTPVGMAAWHGHPSLARLLIERGANINATGCDGDTALHCAAQNGHEEVVALLLREGAHATIRNELGMTPLMWACDYAHRGAVNVLVQHMGAHYLDERDTLNGWTGVHRAAYWGREEVVRCLLLTGADPTVTDYEGSTPRALAEDHHNSQIVRAGRARCVAVFQWWQGELERRALLSRATCLHKAYATQRDQPTSQVPTYLEARVAAGHAVPVVEVVSPQSQQQQEEAAEASGKRKAAGEGGEAQGAEAGEEETRHAVLEYVVKGLNEALLTELLEGFHCEKEKQEEEAEEELEEEEDGEEGEEEDGEEWW